VAALCGPVGTSLRPTLVEITGGGCAPRSALPTRISLRPKP